MSGELVAIIIAAISAAGAGAAWLRVASQNKVDEASAGFTAMQTLGEAVDQIRKLTKDVDQAWLRIRELEHWVQADGHLIHKLVERLTTNHGDSLEGFNGTFAEWQRRQGKP